MHLLAMESRVAQAFQNKQTTTRNTSLGDGLGYFSIAVTKHHDLSSS